VCVHSLGLTQFVWLSIKISLFYRQSKLQFCNKHIDKVISLLATGCCTHFKTEDEDGDKEREKDEDRDRDIDRDRVKVSD